MTAPGTLAEALAALQAQLPHVAKNQRAKVEKDGRTLYTYDYADLADINAALLPVMAPLGLSFTACPTVIDDGPNFRFVLDYKLRHLSGESDGGLYPLPDPARYGPQDLGKAITYARRYALCAVTGLSPGGDDTDAKELQDKHEKRSRNVPDSQLAEEGRMTRAQLAEHRQLEADTKRDDARKKAERSRPRIPAETYDDPGPVTHERAEQIRTDLDGRQLSDPEDKPGSILPAQKRAIELLCGRLGLAREDRDGRHATVATLLREAWVIGPGVQIDSFENLSYQEAGEAIRLLSEEVAKDKAHA